MATSVEGTGRSIPPTTGGGEALPGADSPIVARGSGGIADFGALLSAARDAAVIAGIYLFFTGFAYREYYLTELAGPVSGKSQIDYASTVVYAYRVFSAHASWILLIAAAASLAWLLLARFRLSPWTAEARLPVTVSVVVLLFPLLNGWALETAHADAQQLRLGNTDIPPSDLVFVTVATANQYPKTLQDDAKIEGVTVIGGDDKVTYVLDQAPPTPCQNLQSGFVYAIRNEDIRYYREFQPEIDLNHSPPVQAPVPCPRATR